MSMIDVHTIGDLESALSNPDVRIIRLRNSIKNIRGFELGIGKSLVGIEPDVELVFTSGDDGLQLSADNLVSSIILRAMPECRAIYNRTDIDNAGKITLENLQVCGQIQFIARDKLHSGELSLRDVDIVYADAFARPERPSTGVGGPGTANVDIVQGALTILNLQNSDTSLLSVNIRGLTIGRQDKPCLGSGVLISGPNVNIYTRPGELVGGRVKVSNLETGAIFVDSKIPAGTSDLISGAVFIAYAEAESIVNHGDVTLSGGGVNALGLDNWGHVGTWVCLGKLSSSGESGIGIVNFGHIKLLAVNAIETTGPGARGVSGYSGTIGSAVFGSIVTRGDGSPAIYINNIIDRLVVDQSVETWGASANSLEAGVITMQPAVGLRVDGGRIGEIYIGGQLKSAGKGSAALALKDGHVGVIAVKKGIQARGEAADAVEMVNSSAPLSRLTILSECARAIMIDGGQITEQVACLAKGVTADLEVYGDAEVISSTDSIANLGHDFGNAFNLSGSGTLRIVSR